MSPQGATPTPARDKGPKTPNNKRKAPGDIAAESETKEAKRAGATSKKGGKGDTPTKAGKPAKNDKEAELLRTAIKVKAQLQKQRAHARTLADEIRRSRGDEWRWANNDQNVGELEAKLRELDDFLARHPFSSGFLLHEPKKMKEEAGSAYLVELEKFTTLLPLVGEIQGIDKGLLRMHRQKIQSKTR